MKKNLLKSSQVIAALLTLVSILETNGGWNP